MILQTAGKPHAAVLAASPADITGSDDANVTASAEGPLEGLANLQPSSAPGRVAGAKSTRCCQKYQHPQHVTGVPPRCAALLFLSNMSVLLVGQVASRWPSSAYQAYSAVESCSGLRQGKISPTIRGVLPSRRETEEASSAEMFNVLDAREHLIRRTLELRMVAPRAASCKSSRASRSSGW